MIVYKTPSSSKDIAQETTVYVVQVDSRGRSHHVSDLDCYKEQTCGAKFFERSIANNTSEYTCVQSIVAELCGLNLKLYFKESMNDDDDSSSQPSDEEDNDGIETQHHNHDHSLYQRHHCLEHELIRDHNNGKHHGGYKINAIATALTFNPYTGYYGHIIKSEAYVVLDDGKSELSKRQVWGLLEFIREIKSEYHHLATSNSSNGSSVDGGGGCHYSDEAKWMLMKKAKEYRDGHWVPHSIYEPRHTHNHQHHHVHQHQHQHHDEERPKSSSKKSEADPKKPQADEPYPLHHHRGHKVQYERLDSGATDQATCHHGHSHIHHNGHHECCHDHDVHKYHPSNNTDDGHYQHHHIVVGTKSSNDDDDNDDDIVHERTTTTQTTAKKVNNTSRGGLGFGRIIMNLSDELLCHSHD